MFEINGQPIPFEDVKEYGFEKSARLFSEGNKDLEELLLTLWSMGIQTNACCKGTEEPDHKQPLPKIPYISLHVTIESLNLILALAENILNDKYLKHSNVDFSLSMYRNRNDNFERKRLCFLSFNLLCLTNSQSEQFFKNLLRVAKQVKESHVEFDETTAPPALIVMQDLATKTIDSLDYSQILIKARHGKRGSFAYGKYGLRPNFKTHITHDNIDKIKDIYSHFTHEYDAETSHEI